jgi:imidazolonepropionase-like amidohydrolase
VRAARQAVLVVAALPWMLSAQRGATRRDVPIIIRDVTVVDGTGAAPRTHLDIYIRNGRIAVIAAAGTGPVAPGDSVIDGRGLYAMPGLIDSHVHVSAGDWKSKTEMLLGALRGGVTTVFDVAGDARATSDLQRAVASGEIPGPHIYYLALLGGPTFFTDPRTIQSSQGYVSGTAPWMQAITDSTDLVRAITLAKGTGAIGIKLYAALDSTLVTRATFEAKRQGMKVWAHATTFPGKPADLVAAGADVLAHTPYLVWQGSPRTTDFPARARGDFLGVPATSPVIERLLTQMRDRGTALNATFFVFEAQQEDSVARVRAPWMYAVTKRAAEIGVRIVAGTDGLYNARTDSMPGIHRELELMVTRGGFTPLDAIRSATQNGAWAVGQSAAIGTLEMGKAADIVLLGADPVADIRNTRAIVHVLQDGRVIR